MGGGGLYRKEEERQRKRALLGGFWFCVPEKEGRFVKGVDQNVDAISEGNVIAGFEGLQQQQLKHWHQKHRLSSSPSPQEIGTLQNLAEFVLYTNNLTGPIPSSFGNLTHLTDVLLFENKFSGPLPQMVDLTYTSIFDLQDNHFTGQLPSRLCEGGSLQYLLVANNHFTGPIPRSLRNCTSLIRVRMERNQLQGSLSEDFGSYPHLDYIDLSFNRLSGEISPKWGECENLTRLIVSHNRITGTIPPEMGKLVKLARSVGPHFQPLSGSHPKGVGWDDFFGIPYQIGKLIYLQEELDLSHNSLTRGIPSQFGDLQMLEKLNLSHNKLTGSIRASFRDFQSLSAIDLSYNDLEGPLPDSPFFRHAPAQSFIGNKGLCGDVQGLPKCSSSPMRRLVGRKKNTMKGGRDKIDGLYSMWYSERKITYEDIVEATNNFDDEYCIGKGGYGIVYMAKLPSGLVVAVKKLHPPEDGKSFQKEIEALIEIRHRNIVKFYGFAPVLY
ncbi:putative LRR receptor-like serine/threonine-protein kinase [Acorus calamus]|uniref:non-specific serine/threonine protein kinase n=1 Tax=Acorus calamus TaxID=4465 RepID=A0AAV9E7H4_ACOCL|nr:putative LRR receptor-like serine/threonine-protein kinase [Acorus calamus]